MRTILRATMLGLACATVACAAEAAEHLVLVERATSDKTVNAGGTGDALGNLLVFANPVFDAANKVQRGTDQGYCVRVVPGKSWECFWTLILKDGQITCEGPFNDSGQGELAVTGGTGKYKSTRGSLRVKALDPQQTGYYFEYDLL